MSKADTEHYTIGIVLGDIQSDYSDELLRGFYTCAAEEQVNIIFLMGPQTPQYCSDILSSNDNDHYRYQFDTIYDYAHFAKLDALIIAYGSLSVSAKPASISELLLRYQNIPCLFLEDTPDTPGVPYLMADNYNGMKSIMEHLILVHHYKKIAFISGPPNNGDSIERLRAYHDLMREHHLPVTKDMVAYGNYSENIDDLVENILQNNPSLEAIAFANDNMAKAGYRVCTKHNLLIGQDIAITGFDNVDFAQTMTPPLTSVSHSSFSFSYTALQNAIALCEHKAPRSYKMPCIFHKRCSCGCASKISNTMDRVPIEHLKEFLDDSVLNISEELLSAIPYESNRLYVHNLIQDFFDYIYEYAFIYKSLNTHSDFLVMILQKLLDYPHISSVLMLTRFSNLLQILQASTFDENTKGIISDIISSIHQYTHSKSVTELEKQIIDSNRRAWFVPTFTRDLINGELGMEQTLYKIMERFQMLNVKSAYFYLFDRPIIFDLNHPLTFHEKLRFTAYYNDEGYHYFEEGKRPLLDEHHGFSSFLSNQKVQSLTAFVLFSGLEQYGVLLCEVKQEDIAFVQICSLQIGSLLRFIDLNEKEKAIQKKLHDSFHLIQEKNDILRFISEYDDLSELLNRRGFMERAITLCKKNAGKPAFLIFGDLDHLKEINDSFGHCSGDYALRTVAKLLVDTLPKKALISRIGGDEFLAMVVTSNPTFQEHFLKKIAFYEEKVNKFSNQPFFVEISIGMYGFICHGETDLNEIIRKADLCLYEAKSKRRASIKKV